MARTKKKAKTRSKTTPPSRAKKPAKKAAKKSPAKTSKPARKRGSKTRETDVERRWRLYLQQRTGLEQAVSAVRHAETSLASARELERTRRAGFDGAKASLQELLEIEPASVLGAAERSLLDFSPPESMPPAADD